jgi:hypothetical protein
MLPRVTFRLLNRVPTQMARIASDLTAVNKAVAEAARQRLFIGQLNSPVLCHLIAK